MISKKELADILNLHAFAGDKNHYEEKDVTDDMVKKFDREIDDFTKKYPDYDIYDTEDYIGKPDDDFIDMLHQVALVGGYKLLPESGQVKEVVFDGESDMTEEQAKYFAMNVANALAPVHPSMWQESGVIKEINAQTGLKSPSSIAKVAKLLKQMNPESPNIEVKGSTQLAFKAHLGYLSKNKKDSDNLQRFNEAIYAHNVHSLNDVESMLWEVGDTISWETVKKDDKISEINIHDKTGYVFASYRHKNAPSNNVVSLLESKNDMKFVYSVGEAFQKSELFGSLKPLFVEPTSIELAGDMKSVYEEMNSMVQDHDCEISLVSSIDGESIYAVHLMQDNKCLLSCSLYDNLIREVHDDKTSEITIKSLSHYEPIVSEIKNRLKNMTGDDNERSLIDEAKKMSINVDTGEIIKDDSLKGFAEKHKLDSNVLHKYLNEMAKSFSHLTKPGLKSGFYMRNLSNEQVKELLNGYHQYYAQHPNLEPTINDITEVAESNCDELVHYAEESGSLMEEDNTVHADRKALKLASERYPSHKIDVVHLSTNYEPDETRTLQAGNHVRVHIGAGKYKFIGSDGKINNVTNTDIKAILGL